MSKTVCLNPALVALKGNFTALDEHGHKATLRFRETPWGTKSFGVGAAKRNLSTHPYTEGEQAIQQNFINASALRALIYQNANLIATWRNKYREALEKQALLRGYGVLVAEGEVVLGRRLLHEVGRS